MFANIKERIKKAEGNIEKFILCLEVLLAFLIIVTIVLGLKDLVVLGINVFKTEADCSYEILRKFLSQGRACR